MSYLRSHYVCVSWPFVRTRETDTHRSIGGFLVALPMLLSSTSSAMFNYKSRSLILTEEKKVHSSFPFIYHGLLLIIPCAFIATEVTLQVLV